MEAFHEPQASQLQFNQSTSSSLATWEGLNDQLPNPGTHPSVTYGNSLNANVDVCKLALNLNLELEN